MINQLNKNNKHEEHSMGYYSVIVAAYFGFVSVIFGLIDHSLFVDWFGKNIAFLLKFDCTLLFIIAPYYFLILGGVYKNGDHPDSLKYLRIRESLSQGGDMAILYRRYVERFLTGLDRFLGDADRHDRSWFARLIGLETPGARWTAPAFERCLSIALVYNIAAIYAVWLFSGIAGDAGALVGLEDGALWDRRAEVGLILIVFIGLEIQSARLIRHERLFLGMIFAAFAVAFAVAYGFAVVMRRSIGLPSA